MRGPFILSILLHVAVVLLAWVGLPSFAPDRVIEPQQAIDVAVVTELPTQAPPAPAQPVVEAKPKPEPKPKPPPPPKPQASLPNPPAPPPPPPDAVALPKPPEPKKPEAKPEPKPEPKPVAKPKPEPAPEEPPQKVAEPEVKRAPTPQRKPKPPPSPDDFASVLKTVEKLKKQPRPAPKEPEKSFGESIADALKNHGGSRPQSQQVSRLDQRLSMSEVDALKRQIESCWSPPAGAPNAENLVVEVRLVINRDRTVQSAQIVDTSRMFREPFYRAAAESVIRAIKNPRCTPLALPQGKYDLWKETRLTFDPRELVGR